MRTIIQILIYTLLIISSYFLGYIISKETEKESKDIKKTLFFIKSILEFILCLTIVLLLLTKASLIKTIETKNTQSILSITSLLLIIFSNIPIKKNFNKTSKKNKKRKLEKKSYSKYLNIKNTNKKTLFLYTLPLYISYSITITVMFYKFKIYAVIFPILIFLAIIYSFIEVIQENNKKTRNR